MFSACGSSDGGAPPDAAPDAAIDAAADAAAVGPVGTLIAGGLVKGVTSDDYAIVMDSSAVSAVSLTGGTPQKIADVSNPLGVNVAITGRVALVLSASTAGTSLYVWTTAAGAVKLADASRFAASDAPQVSADGQYVAFLANFTSTTTDVVGAKVDGTAAMTLLTGVDPNHSGIHWVGHYVVTTHATSMSGGVYTFDVASWDASAAWAQVALTSTAHAVHTPRADVGSAIVVNEGTDSLVAYPVAGGSPTALDTGATFAVDILDDGVTVFYETSGGALKKTTISGGTPVTLLQSGFDSPIGNLGRAYSPDVSALLYQTPDLKMQGAYDYALVSLVSPAGPTVFGGHVGAHIGDFFTADSAYALLITTDTPTGPKTVAAAPTAGGSAIPITTGSAAAIYALGRARVLYGGEEQMVTFPVFNFPSASSYTLHVADLGSAAAPATLVTGAFGLFFPSAAKDKLVYTWLVDQSDPRFGTYVAPIP